MALAFRTLMHSRTRSDAWASPGGPWVVVQPTPERPLVRARRRLNLALAAFAVVFGILCGILYGRAFLYFYVPGFIFALVILWAGSDVVRSDERHIWGDESF